MVVTMISAFVPAAGTVGAAAVIKAPYEPVGGAERRGWPARAGGTGGPVVGFDRADRDMSGFYERETAEGNAV
jgi:hypothetical protein